MFALRAVTLLMALVLVSGTGVFSQEKNEPPKDAKTAKDAKDTKDPPKDTKVKGTLPANWGKLGLSDDQKQEVYKTRAKFQDQIKKLQEQIDALKEEERIALSKVLTAEQKKRLTELLTGEKPK